MAARRGSSPGETLEPEPVPTQRRLPSPENNRLRVQCPPPKPLSEMISWLGLGGFDPHRVHHVALQQPVGNRRAQTLERLVGALLGDQVGGVADLPVVDRI